jgi:hypothetical protein
MANEANGRRPQARILAGVLVMLVGSGFLLNNLFDWFSFNYVWPLIIIAVGLYLIVRKPR